MIFKKFVEEIMIKSEINNYSDLWLKLTSEYGLEISLRYFQTICSGKALPTTSVLISFFEWMPDEFKKKLLVSFFTSLFGEDTKGKPLIDFIQNNLHQPIKKPQNPIFKEKGKEQIYNYDQLSFLSESGVAFRIYHKILLSDGVDVPIKNCSSSILEKLVNLELVDIKNKKAYSSKKSMIVPSSRNSDPTTAMNGLKMLLKFSEHYLSPPNTENQIFEAALLTIPKGNASYFFDELQSFYSKLKTSSSESSDSTSTPIVFSCFLRSIDWGDL